MVPAADALMWVSGTLAHNGVFYRTIYPWQGWGGISPDFDEIATGTLSLIAAARDGVIHQGLEYDQPYSWEKEWGATAPFAPRKTARQRLLQTAWERDRLERQIEKERLAEIEWEAAEAAEAAEIEVIKAQEQADRDYSAKARAKRNSNVSRQEVERCMGMTIAQAKAELTPGPMTHNNEPDLNRWQYGIHAHPSLWLWED